MLPGGRVRIVRYKAEWKDLETRILVLRGCFGTGVDGFLAGHEAPEAQAGLPAHGAALRIPVLTRGDNPDSFVD